MHQPMANAAVQLSMDRPKLFERLGGETAIMATVDAFYERLIHDSLVGPMFDGMDVEAITKKQVAFLARAFQGPTVYHGRPLNESHRQLVEEHGMTDVHFDRVMEHLDEVLGELGVEDAERKEVLEVVEATREQVLGRRL